MKKFLIASVLFLLIMLTACSGSLAPKEDTPALATNTITPIPTITPEPSTPTSMSPSVTPLPDYSELVSLFDYDRSAPLDVIWGRQDKNGEVLSDWFKFVSVEKCVSNAILVHPNGEGPYPAVIYMHMGGTTKVQYLDEAITLAEHGVVSLLLDSPFTSRCYFNNNARAGYIGTVIAMRRGIDFLETQTNVDPKKIGFVGHSFGATWGGVLAGVEPRLAAYVLMGGFAQISMSGETNVSDLDAVLYISHNTTAPVLFQFSTKDEYIDQEQGFLLYEAAKSPKKILWYDSTHAGLQQSGQADRLAWLGEQLGFTFP